MLLCEVYTKGLVLIGQVHIVIQTIDTVIHLRLADLHHMVRVESRALQRLRLQIDMHIEFAGLQVDKTVDGDLEEVMNEQTQNILSKVFLGSVLETAAKAVSLQYGIHLLLSGHCMCTTFPVKHITLLEIQELLASLLHEL